MAHGRRRIVAALALAPLGVRDAGAQQKPARIVVLSRTAPELQFVRDGLRDIGQVEGRTYVFDERYADGSTERLHEIAVEAVRTGPNIIYAAHGEAAQAARRATSTIPIVFSSLDPVAEGLVASLARPGGNATGNATGYELGAKRVEVLRDALPAARRLAVLHIDTRGGLAELDAIKAAAARLNFEPLPVLAFAEPELAKAIEGAAGAGAEALMHINSPTYRALRGTIIALAARHRLPAIYGDVESVEAGGLISYANDRRLTGRRLAAQIDRILKGAKPADIPVELPTRYELAVNLRTARELGLTLPPGLVSLADRVVE